MRSFIKTHRRASSLDNSPNKATHESPESRRNSQGSFGTELGYPSSIVLKQSSSFEPLQKLTNNKIFTTKLFRKSASGKNLSGNNSPLLSNQEADTFVHSHINISSNSEGIPAIKGTRKHEWGDNDDMSESVILLNRTSISSMSDSNQGTPDNEIVRIKHYSPQIDQNPPFNQALNEETADLLDKDREKIKDLSRRSSIRRSQSLKKKQNRLARIHSHDDILNLRNQSSFSTDLLGSNFSPIPEKSRNGSPLPKCEMSPMRESQSSEKLLSFVAKKTPELSFIIGASTEGDNVSLDNDTSEGRISFEIKPEISNFCSEDRSPPTSCSVGRDDSRIQKENPPSQHDKEEGEEQKEYDEEEEEEEKREEEDESDSSSKFSFENGNGLTGRTSSLKYYSTENTENNAPQLYVNDIYENDNFDDEMNYFDSNEDDYEDMDHLYGEDTLGLGFSEMCSLSDNEIEGKKHNDTQPDNSLPSSGSSFKDKKVQKISQSTSHDQRKKKIHQPTSYADIYNITDDEGSGNEGKLPDKAPILNGEKYISEDEVNLDEEEEEDAFTKVTDVTDVQSENKRRYKIKVPLKSKTVTKYADLFMLSDNERSTDSEEERSDEDYEEQPLKENSSRNKLLYSNLSPEGSMSVTPTKLRSPKRYMDVLSLNNTPYAFKTPERKTMSSPLHQPLKYHGISSALDNEVQGSMSTLYYIDEVDEDQFIENSLDSEDYYLDEINGIPEDYEFSDTESEPVQTVSPFRPLNRANFGAFRRTHSYSDKPQGVLKENTPVKYKLEIKNKTVTFFDHNAVQRSYSDPFSSLISTNSKNSDKNNEDQILDNRGLGVPVTPSNSFTKPSPNFTQNASLSPIQESTTSSDTSPRPL